MYNRHPGYMCIKCGQTGYMWIVCGHTVYMCVWIVVIIDFLSHTSRCSSTRLAIETPEETQQTYLMHHLHSKQTESHRIVHHSSTWNDGSVEGGLVNKNDVLNMKSNAPIVVTNTVNVVHMW